MIMVKDMNKKGFTLVELLGVIALLGILSVIAVPVIDNALKSSRDNLDKTQQAQIIKGAKEFFATYTYCLPGSNNDKCDFMYNDNTCVTKENNVTSKVTLSCLKAQGFLPQDITNIQTEEKYDGTETTKVTKVKVTKENNSNYKYEVIEE